MSLNKKQKVETVLPPSGSGSPANTQQDKKSYKQELKNRITTLKAQQKDVTKNIAATQKELTKLSGSKKAPKKELQIVKKGKNNKTGKK